MASVVAVILFAFVILINVFKARYGLAWEDEYLYTLGGYRLWQGDALMFDEINVTMLMDLFTYPLVSIYMDIFKTSDGIIYFMRLAYIVFVTIVAIVFYSRFKNKGFGVLFASLFFMLISVFNTMALSYNTMALGFIILSVCVLPNKNYHKYSSFIIFGIMYSFATLNSPFLAIPYFVIFIYCIVNWKKVYYKRLLFGSLIGIIACLLAFAFFIFSRATLNQIISAFPLIFAKGQKTIVRTFLANGYHVLKVFGISIILMLLHSLYLLIKRNTIKNINKQIIASTIIALVSLLCLVIFNSNELPYSLHLGITLIITYVGTVRLILKLDYDCLTMFIFSGFYLFSVFISSDAGVGTISNPLILSSMASLILIADINYSVLRNVVLSIVFCYVLIFKLFFVYGGYTLGLNKEASVGPSKYLYSSSSNIENYEKLWNSFNITKEVYKIKDLTIIGNKNYLYFSDGINVIDRFAFFNTRKTKANHLNDLKEYYNLRSIKDCHILIIKNNNLNITLSDLNNVDLLEENDLYSVLKYSK